jgi:thiol:disulfide interchange protein
MKKILFLIVLLVSVVMRPLTSTSQILNPTQWTWSLANAKVQVGETTEIIFEVTIEKGWYLYSSDFDADLGPIVTSIALEKNKTYTAIGHLEAVKPKKKFSDIWGGEYTYFTKKATFKQKIKIIKPNAILKGSFTAQACTDDGGKCVPVNGDFEFKNLAAGKENTTAQTKPALQPTKLEVVNIKPDTQTIAKTDTLAKDSLKASAAITQIDSAASPKLILKERGGYSAKEEEKGLIYFMLIAFVAGLASLLTPCVFPMIPMTVTFFTNSSNTRKQALIKAFTYGISIILIYTLIGVIAARINGPAFANFISTHWIPNVFFTITFIIFALSFLGMFEITLPSSFVNKVDRQADKGGFYGIFFMAFTIVLVSFSCTGPIVGTILVEAAGGHLLKPILGMVAYSAAFAIPFTLFAIFPEWLQSLPKSGGWLNVVKVTLGFIELALALKFLSIADQVEHWGILNRDLYLTLWIIIFFTLGLYLIGKIRLAHDSAIEKINISRLIMAMLSWSFALYLIPGLWGAPLKSLSGYLPPLSTQEFKIYTNSHAANSQPSTCSTASYSDKLHLPHELNGYFDYKEAIACAKQQNKPLFIDFTGHGCVNCRKMEAKVWSHDQVLKHLNNDFVVAALYVDDPTEVAENKWVISSFDQKTKKTIGAINGDIQITKFNNNAQPYYILLDPFTEQLLAQPMAYNEDVTEFTDFLQEGISNFKKLHP